MGWKIALVALLLGTRALAADSSIVIIVNRSNEMNSITRDDLVDYYQKRKRRWPDGSPVRFIDRAPGSPERQRFVQDFIGKSESEVDLFWFAQKIHSGESMPIQIASDALVIEMVESFSGAVGYVSANTPITNPQVKKISIVGVGLGASVGEKK